MNKINVGLEFILKFLLKDLVVYLKTEDFEESETFQILVYTIPTGFVLLINFQT